MNRPDRAPEAVAGPDDDGLPGPVGVVGTGRMALALTDAMHRAGLSTMLAGVRDGLSPGPLPGPVPLSELLRRAGTVLLALPFPVALRMLQDGPGQAGEGRVLVDVTNPLLGEGSVVHSRISGAEQLARAAPSWRVVKGLNTVSARTLQARVHLAGRPVSVPIASDDPRARAAAFALAHRLGFEPLDAGGLGAAGDLECLARLLFGIGAAQGWGTSRVAVQIGVPQPCPEPHPIGWAPGPHQVITRRPPAAAGRG